MLSPDTTLIKVGTRKSQLALCQTHLVIDKLQEHYPHIDFQVVKISTLGDKILNVALSKIGDKNLFTKELEQALYAKEVDFVVHSLKDVPTVLPENLILGCITSRVSPFDVVLMSPTNRGKKLSSLPPKSVVGTSALRRIAILSRKYPHLDFLSVRGNLSTRLQKLDAAATTELGSSPKYDALILAEAGVQRLGWEDRIDEVLSDDRYAVGQGALACECRQGDTRIQQILASIHDEPAALACIAERSFMCRLEGGCSTPIGVRTTLIPGGVAGIGSEAGRPKTLILDAAVLSLDGTKCVSGKLTSLLPTTKPISASAKPVQSIIIKMTGQKRPINAIDNSNLSDRDDPPVKKLHCDSDCCCFSQCWPPCSLLPEDKSSAELDASLNESNVIMGLNVFPTCLVARLRMVRARRLGEQLAEQLLAGGVDAILNEIKSQGEQKLLLVTPSSTRLEADVNTTDTQESTLRTNDLPSSTNIASQTDAHLATVRPE